MIKGHTAPIMKKNNRAAARSDADAVAKRISITGTYGCPAGQHHNPEPEKARRRTNIAGFSRTAAWVRQHQTVEQKRQNDNGAGPFGHVGSCRSYCAPAESTHDDRSSGEHLRSAGAGNTVNAADGTEMSRHSHLRIRTSEARSNV